MKCSRSRRCLGSSLLRSEFHHSGVDYHFANDLSWSGGPGYYFLRKPGAIVGLQAVISGEHKDVDRFRGEVADDTGITSVFAGPRVLVSLGRVSQSGMMRHPLMPTDHFVGPCVTVFGSARMKEGRRNTSWQAVGAGIARLGFPVNIVKSGARRLS